MSGAAFTPGPWSVSMASFEGQDGTGCAYTVHAPTGMEASASNARLIAASPVLYSVPEEVMAFRKGVGKYRFSHLPTYERANASFDAWQEIETRIVAALAAARGEAS